MTRTRRFLGGAGLGYLNQAVMVVVGVWLTRFLLTRLGAHDYGLWLVTLQIFAYLLLADFGVVALLPREAAYVTGRHESSLGEDLRRLTARTVRLVLWQLPFVALAAVGVWLWLPAAWEPLRGPLAPVLVAFVAFFPLRVLPALLEGLQDLAFVGWAQLSAWVATTIVSVAMVIGGEGLSALASGWIVGQLVLAGVCWVRLASHHREALPAELPELSWPASKAYLAKSVWVSISQVAQVLVMGSDVLIIGATLGPIAVVPYVCTSKLVSFIRNQPLIFLQSAVPGLSEMRTSETRDRVLSATTALMQGTLILSGAATCVILPSNGWFVGWWVGPGNYGGLALTGALLANMLVRHTSTTIAYSVYAFGYERRLAVVGLADGIVSVLGTVALVHLVGAVGAPIASVVSAAVVSLPPLLLAYARATGIPPWLALKPLWPWCRRFGIVLSLAAALTIVRPPVTFIATVAVTGALLLLYLLFQASLLGQAPLARYVPRKVASVLERFSLVRGVTPGRVRS